MKEITIRQRLLLDKMRDYGCEEYSKWLREHPEYKYECRYTASKYIEENMEYYKEQKQFLS